MQECAQNQRTPRRGRSATRQSYYLAVELGLVPRPRYAGHRLPSRLWTALGKFSRRCPARHHARDLLERIDHQPVESRARVLQRDQELRGLGLQVALEPFGDAEQPLDRLRLRLRVAALVRVVVAGVAGGVGATTLAALLARTVARARPGRVAPVDHTAGTLAERAGVGPDGGGWAVPGQAQVSVECAGGTALLAGGTPLRAPGVVPLG